jgi:hypothetical protein
MKKTIAFTAKTTKWIFVINGFVNACIGFRQISISESWTSWGSVLGFLLIFAGPLMIVYGLILFAPPNRFTPKVQVDYDGIIIKENILEVQRQIDWKNVKEISYRPFELTFHLSNNSIETVKLSTSGETSMDLKKTVREFAEERQIKIVGG